MLKDELKSLPTTPGVYQYFGADGRLLYVGKAKVLKNRVKSYFAFTPDLGPSPRLSPRIAKMISEATHIEWISTASESDALILENSFIKQLKPKYNILLRDDKTYPYIYVNLASPFPRFEITRKVVNGRGVRYFGPFYKGAKEILEAIYGEFALVQKKSCLREKKACIYHQMGRCAAPCEGKITPEAYAQILEAAMKKLKNPASLVPALEEKMLFHAQNENFEEAAHLRDMINTINDASVKVQIDVARLEDFEVVALAASRGALCAVRFSVREGRVAYANHNITAISNLTSQRSKAPLCNEGRERPLDPPEVTRSACASVNSTDLARDNSNLNAETDGADDDFLGAIYRQTLLEAFPAELPVGASKIFVYRDFEDAALVAQILSARHGVKFEVFAPKIGEKRKICDLAYENALALIDKHLRTHNYEFLRGLQEYFSLTHLPLRIECFDNSHLFGAAPVGGMIAWDTDKFNKNGYRHVHLESLNDYDQMREMLVARAQRFDKLAPPDLWVLDGGDALLGLAREIAASSGANIDIIAISKEKIDAKAHRAKGKANDNIYASSGKFVLAPSDPKLQFFQRLRDEAHRFAITFHQKTRRKEDLASGELTAAGVSAGSIAKLIKYFGTFEAIKEASAEEIAKVTNKSVAEKIMNLK